jgi:aromatic-L-amino-acid/L-tryptophan decarboxylase
MLHPGMSHAAHAGDILSRMDSKEFRAHAARAVDLAAEHLSRLEEGPVFRPMTPEERLALLELPLPRTAQPLDAALDLARERVLSHPMGNGHPRFFGWVNSPPSPAGIVAELLASAANPSVAGGDHAATYLERAVVRWMMELVGFPRDGSMGLLTSGGSAATIIGLAAARQRAAIEDGWNAREEGLQGGRPRLVLYMSEEGHSCIRKAVELLGLGSASIRTVAMDPDLRLDVADLRRAVAKDRALGLRPFCVAASAGTVNSGAIDPIDTIADACRDEGLWLHVDGAYGGVAAAVPGLAPLFSGMDRADSLAMDPHKWLSVPAECGCVLVRDGALLRETFSLVPSYLRTEEGKGFGGLPWFSEYGPQQTRGFRALKLWMTLWTLGRDGVADRVTRHVALAKRLARSVSAAPDLELLASGPLSIVCFRYAPGPARRDDAALDRINKELMERIQSGGEAFVSGTSVGGRFALRACVLHDGTDEGDVDALVDIVRREGSKLFEEERA